MDPRRVSLAIAQNFDAAVSGACLSACPFALLHWLSDMQASLSPIVSSHLQSKPAQRYGMPCPLTCLRSAFFINREPLPMSCAIVDVLQVVRIGFALRWKQPISPCLPNRR